MIELSKKWALELINKPETGQGFQIVTIMLINNEVYEQVLINSGYITTVRGYKIIPFNENQIAGIVLTHDIWNW